MATTLSPSVPWRSPEVTDVAVVTDDDVVWARIGQALALAARARRATLMTLDPDAVPDLVALHVPEPDGSAIAAMRQARAVLGLDARLVLICERLTTRGLRRALDAGLRGLLLTDQIECALAPAVAAALAGQITVPVSFAASLRRRPLSFREKQIVALAVLGYTNSQIGSRLYLAESTVKSHLSSSFAKLGISSRGEAAALINDPDEPLGLEISRIGAKLDGLQVTPAA